MDTAAAIMDPIGTLVASGLRWLLDHIEPLKGWLDDLAGNAGEVQAFAATWSNVAGRMNELGVTAENRLADLDGLSGETVDADTVHVRGLSQQLSASGQWADAVSTGLSMASSIVQLTHDLVRDAISQIVGMTVSSVSTTVITAGAGALAVAAQVSTRVSALLPRISKTITTVVNALGKLRGLIDKLSALAGEALAALRRWTGGRRAAPSTIDMRPLSLAERYTYRRPSGFRKGVRATTFENAKDHSGVVRDSLTGRTIHPDKPWDMGHLPGWDFRKHQVSAADRGISRAEFLNEHNDWRHYRPELPKINRSHVGEDQTDLWLGP